MKWFDNDNRWFKMLRLLEKNYQISAEQMAEELDVSSRTIKNDIKKLEDMLKGIAIINLKNSLYSLYVLNTKSYLRLKNDIQKINGYFESPVMRLAFIYETLFNSNSPIFLDELAYTMSVGRTTLINDIAKLKEYIGGYGLSIDGKTNTGIVLNGKELSKRSFILENFYSIIYEDSEMESELIQFASNMLEVISFDRATIKSFSEFMTISIDRMSQGKYIEIKDSEIEILRDNPFYGIISRICDHMEEEYGLKIPVEERIFILTPIAGMITPVVVDGIEKIIDIPGDVLDLVENIVNDIKKDFNVVIPVGEVLNEFIYHIYFLTNRILYGYNIKNPVNDELRKKYPVAYLMALRAKEIVDERYDSDISEDEIGFLTSYFEIFIVEQKSAKEMPYRVCIVCDRGKAVSRLIHNQLKGIFDSDTEYAILPQADIFSFNFEEYDLIVSTARDSFDTIVPVIYIDEMMDDRLLRQRIETYRYIRKIDIPLINGIRSILFSLLNPDRFFVLEDSWDYKKSLDYMLNELYDKGDIDEDFIDGMHEREKRSSIVFNDKVAFPHINTKNMNRPLISIGVRRGGIRDINHPAIIFLVGIPKDEDDSTLLVQLYDELVLVASNDDAIGALSSSSSYQELMISLISETDLFRKE